MQTKKVSLSTKLLRLFLYKTPIESAIVNGRVPLWLTGHFDSLTFPEAILTRWKKCQLRWHGLIFVTAALTYVLYTGRSSNNETFDDWLFAMCGAYGILCFLHAHKRRRSPSDYQERLRNTQRFIETFHIYATPNFGCRSREKVVSTCRAKAERTYAMILWHVDKGNHGSAYETRLNEFISAADGADIAIERDKLREEASKFFQAWKNLSQEEAENLADL